MTQTAKEWIEEKEKAELMRAVEFFGTAKNMGEFLGYSHTGALSWIARGRISATAAAKLETLLPDQFNAAEMRPDVKLWWHRTRNQGAE